MNGVVVSTTLHDHHHSQSKGVIYENNVKSLLDNLSTSNTHGGPDVGGLECGAMVHTIARDTDDLTKVGEGSNKNHLSSGEDWAKA